MTRKGMWNWIVVAAAVAAGLALSAKPWRVYVSQKEKAQQAQQDMREAERNRASLTRMKARYESSVGREELARKQGYTRPGENVAESR